MMKRVVVTGAFSYTGAAVAREFHRRGWRVHTLTNRAAPAGNGPITVSPLRFELDHLRRELSGADAFVNTFWIRFPWRGQNFDTAVDSSRLLLDAARGAGRVVHVSVSNAVLGASLGYYRGKATIEAYLRASTLSYAIVRPTLVVGAGDVLTNNIAWLLRTFPLFLMPGGGRYRLQPVTLADTARIIADAVETRDNVEVDAAGPEIFSFGQYIRLVAAACGLRPLIVNAPNWLALAALRMVRPLVRDVVLTREELLGLEQELLLSHAPPLGQESVADWLRANGAAFGRSYVNDLSRHFGAGAAAPILDPATSIRHGSTP